MHEYRVTMGDDEPLSLPDDLSMAQEFMHRTVDDLSLPAWRRLALHQQIDNMPRAGLSFTTQEGALIKVEHARVAAHA